MQWVIIRRSMTNVMGFIIWGLGSLRGEEWLMVSGRCLLIQRNIGLNVIYVFKDSKRNRRTCKYQRLAGSIIFYSLNLNSYAFRNQQELAITITEQIQEDYQEKEAIQEQLPSTSELCFSCLPEEAYHSLTSIPAKS